MLLLLQTQTQLMISLVRLIKDLHGTRKYLRKLLEIIILSVLISAVKVVMSQFILQLAGQYLDQSLLTKNHQAQFN